MADYQKARNWNGKDLSGVWIVTKKLDGVRVLVKNGVALSRAGKPLHNLVLPDGDYEVFKDDWATSVSMVRTLVGEQVDPAYCFSLNPLDSRLIMDTLTDPSAAVINAALSKALDQGLEGVVLHGPSRWLKAKPLLTFDVPVIGRLEGEGKHTGRLGALVTPMGAVGTGFTDAEREADYPIGTVIEVICQELTPDGKFRFPRFHRVRWDKA